MRGEPIRVEPPACRRLDDDGRSDTLDQRNDGGPPASVMRKLHDVRGKVDPARVMPRHESRRRLGLDVSGEKQSPRTDPTRIAARLNLDPDHERAVVLTSRTEPVRRPEHRPRRGADPQDIALPDEHDLGAGAAHAIEELPHRGHRRRFRGERLVHHHAPHACVADDVEHRAEVIEVRMTDEGCVDRTSARIEPRSERLCRDPSMAARACVEESHDAVRLHDVRRSIADGERGHIEERRFGWIGSETDSDARHDRDHGDLRADPKQAPSRDDRADTRDREHQHEDRRRSTHHERPTSRRERELDEPDL